ncbi:hypothetical protein [Veillonella montpellierensis]|uniref:hypothetical protein n=1 Tax=Veillonella montpellierensis TaxID=187328 RepID=UPI001E544611|nr:hypothetical protein [Veillonella montpellierensis]
MAKSYVERTTNKPPVKRVVFCCNGYFDYAMVQSNQLGFSDVVIVLPITRKF